MNITHPPIARSLSTLAVAFFAVVGCDAPPPPESAGPPALPTTAEPAVEDGLVAGALRDPDPYARARELGALLPTLDAAAIPEVRKTLENFRLHLGAVEFELLLRFWATHEPKEATYWVYHHGPPAYKTTGVRTAIEVWAEQDPAGGSSGAADALKQAGAEAAMVAGVALVRGWFNNGDREGLLAFIEGLGQGIDRQRALSAYALSLAAADGPEAVVAWAESVPADNAAYRVAVYRQALSALIWADLEAASGFCEAHCNEVRGLREVVIRRRLHRGDPGGDVVAWVAGLPAEGDEERDYKQHSIGIAFSTWAREDHEAALAWFEERAAEQAPDYEPWLRMLFPDYARYIAADDPARALEWADRVEKPNERENLFVRISRYWLIQDPEAAEAWLAQADLPERAMQLIRRDDLPIFLPRVSRRGEKR